MKKYIFLILTIFTLGLGGCNLPWNAKPLDVTITEPIKTEDPFLKLEEAGFAMFKDGSNNYLDEMLGYIKVETIPEKYNNYENLLNHSGEYNSPEVEDFSTQIIDYDFVASYKEAKEGYYNLQDYTLSSLMPGSLDSENTVYEKKYVDVESHSEREYSLSVSEDSVYYNAVQTLGTAVKKEDFLQYFEEQTAEKWNYFLADIFTVTEGVEPVFSEDDGFFTMVQDCSFKITYLEKSYTGKLIVSLDQDTGSFIYTFLGYPEEVLEKENDDLFNKKHLIDSFALRYTIEKNAADAKSTHTIENGVAAEEFDLEAIDLVNDLDILIDYDYFKYELLPEDNEDEELLKQTILPATVQIERDDSRGSAFIYKIEEDYIYFITAKHCTMAQKKDTNIMFFNGEEHNVKTEHVKPSRNVDILMFRIRTEEVPKDLLLELKQTILNKNYKELKDNQNLYIYAKNHLQKKDNERFICLKKIPETAEIRKILRNDEKNVSFHTRNMGRPGMSGSCVFNNRGEVYGVLVSIMRKMNTSTHIILDDIDDMEFRLRNGN